MSQENQSEITPPSQTLDPNNTNKTNMRVPYVLKQTVGEGAFAKVKLAIQIHTKEKLAIKIFKKSRFKDDNDIFKFNKEIKILKRLRHKNIIQLYDVLENSRSLFIAMEYCEGGEFFDYIVSRKRIPEDEACSLFQQIINGVEYLHEQNIIHRDLKLENILLDSNKNIKISDFGLSTFSSKNAYLSTPCGTPSYAPPEMLRGEKYKGTKSDVWSCGIILYAMLCGALPFAESDEKVVEKRIMSHDYIIPSYLSKEARNLLNNILKVNPDERYGIEDIKKDNWFNRKNPQMMPGLTIGKHVIPIDEKILDMVEEYGFDRETCRKLVQAHKYCPITCVYYLCVKKRVKEGGTSVSDLNGKEFAEYIKDPRHLISPKGKGVITSNEGKKDILNSNDKKNNDKVTLGKGTIGSNDKHPFSKTPILVSNTSAKSMEGLKNKKNLSKGKREKEEKNKNNNANGKNIVKIIIKKDSNNISNIYAAKKVNKISAQRLIAYKPQSNNQIKGIQILQSKNNNNNNNITSQEISINSKKKLKDFSSNNANSLVNRRSFHLIEKSKSNEKTISKLNTNKPPSTSDITYNKNQQPTKSSNAQLNLIRAVKKRKTSKFQNHPSNNNQSINKIQSITAIQNPLYKKNITFKENSMRPMHQNQKSSPCPIEEFKLENDNEEEINLEEMKFDNVLEYISKRLVAKSFCGSFNFPLSQNQQNHPIDIKDESEQMDNKDNKGDSSSFKNTVSILHQKYKAYLSKNTNKINKTYKTYLNEKDDDKQNDLYQQEDQFDYGGYSRRNKFLDISTNFIQGFESRGESSVDSSISVRNSNLRSFSFSPQEKSKNHKLFNLNASFNFDKSSNISKVLCIGVISEDDEFQLNSSRKVRRKVFNKAEKKVTINLSASSKEIFATTTSNNSSNKNKSKK